MQLRPYQTELLDRLRVSLSQRKRPIVVSPTGSGKTVMFCAMAKGAQAKGKRVYIVVHREELIEQTVRTLREVGVEPGIIAAGHRGADNRIQVASVYTLARREAPAPDFMVVDEAHHMAAKTWSTIAERYPSSHVAGFTATPARLDGKALGAHFDVILLGPSMTWLIEHGFLAQFKYYAPDSCMDGSKFSKQQGDFKRDEISAWMDRPKITGDAIDHYKRFLDHKPTLAFCTSVAHAEHTAEQFRSAGYRAYSVDGTMDKEERRARIRGLETGHTEVLTSCELVSEGLDVPGAYGAILLRPTASLSVYMQQIGRVLRPGKVAIVLDHVGNIKRHGWPDEEREWSLEGKAVKQQRTVKRMHQCEVCFACFEGETCPQCGSARIIKVRQEIKQTKGELEELQRTEQLLLKRRVGMAKTREELEAIAKEKGYKPGWVYWKMKSRKKKC